MCKHTKRHQVGPERCFNGSVAVRPYTEQNPAAHGHVTFVMECDRCGARRKVNENQGFIEVGPWSHPTTEEEA